MKIEKKETEIGCYEKECLFRNYFTPLHCWLAASKQELFLDPSAVFDFLSTTLHSSLQRKSYESMKLISLVCQKTRIKQYTRIFWNIFVKKIYLLVNLHTNSPLLQTWQTQSMRKILEVFYFEKNPQNKLRWYKYVPTCAVPKDNWTSIVKYCYNFLQFLTLILAKN